MTSEPQTRPTDPADPTERRGRPTRPGLRELLARPVDQPRPAAFDPTRPETGSASAPPQRPPAPAGRPAVPADRPDPAPRGRRSVNRVGHYRKKIAAAAAAGDHRALLAAHYDRIRSLDDPDLTRRAAAALAALLEDGGDRPAPTA